MRVERVVMMVLMKKVRGSMLKLRRLRGSGCGMGGVYRILGWEGSPGSGWHPRSQSRVSRASSG